MYVLGSREVIVVSVKVLWPKNATHCGENPRVEPRSSRPIVYDTNMALGLLKHFVV